MKDDFKRYFKLSLDPVAVKFLDKELKESERSYRYCEAVRIAASQGKKVVLNKRNISCSNALSVLGLLPSVFDKNPKYKSIVIEPYKGQDCDVVIVITTPERVMKIASSYYQIFKKEFVARFSGETAVCGEATIEVMESNEPNVTFLCQGARKHGGYKFDEVVIGFPFEIFKLFENEIRKNRIKSLCGCLMDDLPRHIVERFEKLGFDKATDHFIGMFNGKIIRLYILKGEKLYGVAIFTSIKCKDEKEAERIIKNYKGDLILVRRENWIDVSKTLEYENFEEDVLRDEFERELKNTIDVIIKESKSLVKQSQQL